MTGSVAGEPAGKRSVRDVIAGPLVTAAAAVGIWALMVLGSLPLDPVPILFLAAVWGAVRGRVAGGLASATVAVLAAAVLERLRPAGIPAGRDLVDGAILVLALLAAVLVVGAAVARLLQRAEDAEAARAVADRRATLVVGDSVRQTSERSEAHQRWTELTARLERQARVLELVETALDAAPQGIGVVQQGRLVWWNRALAELTGVPESGRAAAERADGAVPGSVELDGSPLDAARVAEVLETGETVTALSTGAARPDGEGERAWVEQYYPLRTRAGERLVGITIARAFGPGDGAGAAPDASAPASAPAPEIAPEIAVDNLDPALVEPDIIDTLRAPLAAIREYVFCMVAGPDEPRRRIGDEYGSRVLGAAQLMDDRIAGLAEYARVARGPVELAAASAADLVDEALRGMEEEIAASGARLRVVIEPDAVPALVDRSLFVVALRQLVANAIKYVPADVQPRVQVHARPGESGAALRLEVEDNGIGLAEGAESRLFRLFARLPEAEAYPGNGTGLAIVRAAAERMGGSYGVASEAGWGSCFWIEVPAAVGAAIGAGVGAAVGAESLSDMYLPGD